MGNIGKMADGMGLDLGAMMGDQSGGKKKKGGQQ